MSPLPALFLIADDDEEHVQFLRDRLTDSSLHLTVWAHTPAETLLYLESLAVHNPTQRALPCVLLLGFTDHAATRHVLQALADNRPLRPRAVGVTTDRTEASDQEFLVALGANCVVSRFPSAEELRRLLSGGQRESAA